jgi:hypothetical protein
MVALTDQVTQVVKKYFFFDIPVSIFRYFLLDGLEAGRRYAIKWLLFDMSGNINGYTAEGNTGTTSLYDETPPSIASNALVERTDTTARFHLTTNELLKKLRVRYRMVGATAWDELVATPTTLDFDVDISGLSAGQEYEYQYILDDNSNNQLITEWVKI